MSIAEQGTVAAIIPAGGAGRRFGPAQPKQFVELAGWPVLAHTLTRFDQVIGVDQIILVVPYDHVREVRKNIVDPLGLIKALYITAGGETRQESVYQGFLALDDEIDLVVIHDAVRPLVRASIIEEVITAARDYGAAIAAMPVRDTLKRVENGMVQDTLDRNLVWQAQTPQAFERQCLAEALAAARRDGFVGTDEASLVERTGAPVRIVHGAAENIKITMPEDLILAETLIEYGKERGMRVGMGFDVHTLAPGRKLMLGCVEVPFDRGLEGHSDADVMAHALCDAMLGAAGLGDIGTHFPDNSPKWAGASGSSLLSITAQKIREAGFDLTSADVTLLAQKPKIKDYRKDMIQAMAAALSVDPSCLNVKATTTEGMGAVGREEGLAAAAAVLLARKSK